MLSICVSHRPAITDAAFVRRFLPYIPDLGSIARNRKLLSFIPHKATQRLSRIIDTLHNRSVEIFEAKKAALARGDEAVTRQIGEGKDLMSILSAYAVA